MKKVRVPRPLRSILSPLAIGFSFLLLLAGCGSVGPGESVTSSPTVTISASPASITAAGQSSTLTVAATNATTVTITGSDGSSYPMTVTGGTQVVKPSKTTTYTASANGAAGTTPAAATATVTVGGTPPPPSAPSVTITASPSSITDGQSSTLTVAATNATTVTITGDDGSSYKLQVAGGTQVVTPTATTTYTATANGAAGTTSATATATVTVGSTPPPPAPTVTITAAPTSIMDGQSSTLTVAATNATTVTIVGSDGSSYNLAIAGGTQVVTPSATTTYTATAAGAAGTTPMTAKATVTVTAAIPPPTVTISANPISIAAGSSSTLTVAATNATGQVTVSGSDGTSYSLPAAGGTQTVKPAATTIYTATATGPGGNSTPATATVTVTPAVVPPTVTIAANPATINAGSNSTLTVVAANATTVTMSGNDGSSFTLSGTGGTQVVTPAATTTYTVTAVSGALQATATATVTVVPAPPPPVPTVTITASPDPIMAGGSSTLTVTATNATSLVISGSDGSSPTVPPTGGTASVSPTSTTSYTVTVTGPGGSATGEVTVTVNQPGPTLTITASPASIASGSSSTLTMVVADATALTVTGTDGSSYSFTPNGTATQTFTQSVSPTSSTTYTATADGASGTTPATGTATVTVVPPGTVDSINHVIFMLQENHSFDNYFGMLNPYRQNNNYNIGDDGVPYNVDGIDDKVNGQAYPAVNNPNQIIGNKDRQLVVHTLFPLKSTCIDDMSSAWSESYNDVSLGNTSTTRQIKMNGYVSNAQGFATSKCPPGSPGCTGYSDTSGDRAMGYYDQGFLNYYYYMASQFALSDRWFSPVSSKSIPNRIATFTGGTTQGLTQDPNGDDKLNALTINNIFQELDTAKKPVSWKVYYTVDNGECDPEDCKKNQSGSALYPATTFSYLTYAYKYVGGSPPCTGTKQPSSVVGDTSNSFCIDPNHVAPLNDATYGYFADLKNGTLPSFAFIESGSGLNDEHPGYQQSVLTGQAQVAKNINALMTSASWKDSVFFLGYDEGGGPYDHVAPVSGHTNDFTTASAAANYPKDVTSISVSADNYNPCVPAAPGDLHCDLRSGQPGSNSTDAAYCAPGTYCANSGFGAQLGFRVPNMVVSPFARRHYVSHVPMDHTAVIKFVEDRFIGNGKYLTPRDAAQPNLMDFFDFSGVPWATPPTPPAPNTTGGTCNPTSFH